MSNEKTRLFGVVLFALVGVAAIVLGVIQAKERIQGERPSPEEAAALRAGLEARPIDRVKDTDGDGLPDYDEQTIYRTSAYIKDSDSDGIDDRTEVERGSDPTCPEGRDCGYTPPPPAPEQDKTPLDEIFTDEFKPFDEAARKELNRPSADRIRELLREAGIPDDVLATLSDADLVSMYLEAADEVERAVNEGGAPQ